jgi:hypothetical protein
MRKSMPIPVRLSFDMIERLEKCAAKLGLPSRTALLKMCVTSFLDDFERNGIAGLPLDWRKIVRDLDGRTHRYQQNINVVAEQSVVNGDLVNQLPGPVPSGKSRRRRTRLVADAPSGKA